MDISVKGVRFLERVDGFPIGLLSYMMVASEGSARRSRLHVAYETATWGLAPGWLQLAARVNQRCCAASPWRLFAPAAPLACPGPSPSRAALSCSPDLLTQALALAGGYPVRRPLIVALPSPPLTVVNNESIHGRTSATRLPTGVGRGSSRLPCPSPLHCRATRSFLSQIAEPSESPRSSPHLWAEAHSTPAPQPAGY